MNWFKKAEARYQKFILAKIPKKLLKSQLFFFALMLLAIPATLLLSQQFQANAPQRIAGGGATPVSPPTPTPPPLGQVTTPTAILTPTNTPIPSSPPKPTATPTPTPIPSPTSLINSLIADINASGLTPSYKTVFINQLNSAKTYLNLNSPSGKNSACSVLNSFKVLLTVYANPANRTGMTTKNLQDWTAKTNLIRSRIPCAQ